MVKSKKILLSFLSLVFLTSIALFIAFLPKPQQANAWNYSFYTDGGSLNKYYFNHWQTGQGTRVSGETVGKWYFGSGDVYNTSGESGANYYSFTQNNHNTTEDANDKGRYTSPSGVAHKMQWSSEVLTRNYTYNKSVSMFVWESEAYGSVSFNGLISKATSNKEELAKTQYGLDSKIWIPMNWGASQFNWNDGDSYTISIYIVSANGNRVTEITSATRTYTSEFVYLVPTTRIPVETGDKIVFSIKCNSIGGGRSEWTTTMLSFITSRFYARSNAKDSYEYMYNPLGGTVWSSYNGYFQRKGLVESAAPLHWATKLYYKAGHTDSVRVSLPCYYYGIKNVKGYAMYVSVPASSQDYTFNIYLSHYGYKSFAQYQKYYLFGDNGTFSTGLTATNSEFSVGKAGFTGWIVFPLSFFAIDDIPGSDNIILQIGTKKTTNLEFTVGGFVGWRNLEKFLYDSANLTAVNAYYTQYINWIIDSVNDLTPTTTYQTNKKAEMLTYFNNVKSTFSSMSTSVKITTMHGLNDKHVEYYNDYIGHEIVSSTFISSAFYISDTHLWISGDNSRNITAALSDMETIDKDASVVINLGDLSDTGVSVTDPSKSSFENYYNLIATNYLTNSNNQKVPWLNITGNHDVRGPTDGSTQDRQANYEAMAAIYQQKEGVSGGETVGGKYYPNLNFVKKYGGINYVAINTCQYEWDACRLTEKNTIWLDTTLTNLEQSDPDTPIFILVHQTIDVANNGVYVLGGKSFERILSEHPNTIVMSGHTHDPYPEAHIIQDKVVNGYKIPCYVNQPSLYYNYYGTKTGDVLDYGFATLEYYYVRVYQNGVIMQAREGGMGRWITQSFVAQRAKVTSTVKKADGTQMSSTLVNKGDSVTLPQYTPSSGKVFVGWLTNDNKLYKAGTSVTLNASKTFTAKEIEFGATTGARIRLSTTANDSGLRFEYKFKTADYTALSSFLKGYGGLVLPTDTVGGKEINHTNFVAGSTMIDKPADTSKSTTSGGYTLFHLSLTKINTGNYGRAFSTRGYIKVSYSDGSTGYIYTAYSATNNSRSVSALATNFKTNDKTFYDKLYKYQKDIIDAFAAANKG